ncbi:MAG: cytochrome c biogenesis heme-transporting ATPase CcmA [Formivibrio sp.]|nr:cytochrome c biogenesis heme-transporting ATPase CcmA [Formivibrio sp.]
MLSVAGLTCVRGDRCLFSDLEFVLNASEWLQVDGENGAGKTSLLRIVVGLLPPTEGEIRWNNQRVRENRDEFNGNLLYLGHAAAIKEELTTMENLRMNAAIAGQHVTEVDALKALQQIGLKGREKLPARFLSQGQKHLVALARLLVSPALLWVLDEPFVALDATAVKMLCGLIGKHLDQGGMVLYTSHQAVALPAPGRTLKLTA